jgi:fatty-acyl-CoA synthase
MPPRIDQIGRTVSVAARRAPGRVAFKDRRGGQRTYGEVESRTNKLANALLGAGLTKGDRVATWLTDSVEYLELYIAVAKAGLCMVPINTLYTASEATFMLDDAQARALFFDAATAGAAAEALAQVDVRTTVAVGAGAGPAVHEFETFLGEGADGAPPPPGEDDVLMIGYTSGTTGHPKGALLTHRAIKNIARMNSVSYRQPQHAVCLYSGSMSFVATIAGWVGTFLWLGGTIVVMGPWELDELFDTVEREQATFVYVPSPRVREFALAAEARPTSLSTLTGILHSASKVERADLEFLAKAVDGRLVEGLGMTENSGGLVTATTREEMRGNAETDDIFASVGRPAVDCEIMLSGPHGEELPWDGKTIGELCFRTPALLDGYWGNPEATAAAFTEGWWHSGDLGMIDPAGYVYVVDRRNDLIVSGGMNVYPSEVERVISEMPEVREVKVVGAPHERWGQTVVACVITAPGETLTEDDVIAHCKKRMASFKKPTTVLFMEDLPRTASQKVKTGELRNMVRNRLA